jgi:signal transduction histidine kinase
MSKDSSIHSILLVEDNLADARLVSRYLANNDIIKTELLHVVDMRSALEVLHKQEFSVILLDLSLPDSFGLDTLQKLRTGVPSKTLNTIVLTGDTDKKTGISAIRAGAQDFLIKGNIDADSLGKSIRFAIERVQTYRFLDQTQRSAKIGSWRYILENDVFQISDIVFEILGLNPFGFETLKEGIEKSEGKFLIFNDLITQNFNQSIAQKDISLELSNNDQRYLILKFERNLSIDNQVQLDGTIQDITERVKANELAKEAEFNKRALEMKERFIANVSHEMRTPMNVILGLSRLLLDTKLSDVQLTYLNSIIHSGDMLLGIVNDILEISSHQQGRLELIYKSVNIRDLIKNIETQMKPRVEEKILTAQYFVANEVPEILEIDQLRLQQILMNLVGNAIKFTENGGIKVSVNFDNSHEQRSLKIMIEDTGIGIPTEKIDSVFEPFVRVISKEKLHEGTGLGLTIVKTWIEKMNGSIIIQSKLGKGTNVLISLPVHISDQQSPELKSPKSRKNGLLSLKKILLVDDHALNRLVAQKTIQQKFPNCEIIIAENGKQALEKIENELPGLVLMDLQMPVMDGYEATWMIRKSGNELVAGLPVLAMTANAYITKDTELNAKGFTDYILKPFDVDELVEKINLYCK